MNRAATFLAVGDAPAIAPVFALGARGIFSPCYSVERKLESSLLTVSMLWR